jgi:hypothetical protein
LTLNKEAELIWDGGYNAAAALMTKFAISNFK